MKRIILATFLIFALAGCNAMDDMKGFFEKKEIVEEAIKKETGWESQVGYNMLNGVITDVSVVFDAEDVRDEKVSELETLVRKVVSESFDSTPQVVYIQIATALQG
ncbi:MAG: membrane lipoprotein lipid attachment site-containing protein [Gammaproteobacteria bacterium]